MRVVLPLALLCALGACVGNLQQENRLCPCASGWVCAQGRCVQEGLVCPGICGDGIVCPGEECDDGDLDGCTPPCNATCSGPANPNDPLCTAPSIFFPLMLDEVIEIPPSGEPESLSYVLHVQTSNPYYRPITVNFGISHDLNDGKLAVTPANGRAAISAGETQSEPIVLEIFRDAVSVSVRSVYVALLATDSGVVTAPSLFTLAVRNAAVPTVVATQPESGATFVPVDTELEVHFSRQMNTEATLDAITIEPPVEGTVTWSENDTHLAFVPTGDLEPQTIYEVAIGAGAMGANNVHVFEQVLWFETFGANDVALIMTAIAPLL